MTMKTDVVNERIKQILKNFNIQGSSSSSSDAENNSKSDKFYDFKQ